MYTTNHNPAKDTVFIAVTARNFEAANLPLFIATDTCCYVRQSIPVNKAIQVLATTAKQLGLTLKTGPATPLQNANLATVRNELHKVRQLAVRHSVGNYFVVSEGASVTANNNSPVIRRLRDSLIAWEINNNGDPDEDWGEHYS